MFTWLFSAHDQVRVMFGHIFSFLILFFKFLLLFCSLIWFELFLMQKKFWRSIYSLLFHLMIFFFYLNVFLWILFFLLFFQEIFFLILWVFIYFLNKIFQQNQKPFFIPSSKWTTIFWWSKITTSKILSSIVSAAKKSASPLKKTWIDT